MSHLREGLFGSHGLRYAQTRQAIIRPNVRSGCAPCKGGAFRWVQVPPGSRSMESVVLRPQMSKTELLHAFDEALTGPNAAPRIQ